MTGNDVINLTFENLAVIQPGELITTTLQTAAQTRLNMFLASLSAEQQIAYQQVTQTFNLVPGVGSYTLGPSGTFATLGGLRSMKATSWRATFANMDPKGGPVLAMDQFGPAAGMIQEKLAAIVTQAVLEGQIASFPNPINAPVPSVVAADTAYPANNIRISPVPGSFSGSIDISYWTPLVQLTDFTLALTVPAEYQAMLVWGLTVDLYTQYARPGASTIEVCAGNYQRYKSVVMALNTVAPQAQQAPQGGQ